MAQEDVFQGRVDNLGEESGRVEIVHVAAFGLNTRLKIFGISAVDEHGEVVIGLDDEIIGLGHIMTCAVGDSTEVGSEYEIAVVVIDGEAHIVGAVVRHVECRDVETSYFEGEFLEDRDVIILDTFRDIVTSEHAEQHTISAI